MSAAAAAAVLSTGNEAEDVACRQAQSLKGRMEEGMYILWGHGVWWWGCHGSHVLGIAGGEKLERLCHHVSGRNLNVYFVHFLCQMPFSSTAEAEQAHCTGPLWSSHIQMCLSNLNLLKLTYWDMMKGIKWCYGTMISSLGWISNLNLRKSMLILRRLWETHRRNIKDYNLYKVLILPFFVGKLKVLNRCHIILVIWMKNSIVSNITF